ncbi:MAG: HEPN domain-containing protein [Deltaproteobacteria bacterium]|jgi:HEPN domain-containing protein|nr:HEPN domain-containing protein [Deltaproteobacteria bacterium]
MGPEEKYQYWLKDAQYDIESAEHNLTGARWFYSIFMCQQAIEKLAKGLFGPYFDFNTIPLPTISKNLSTPLQTKHPCIFP